MNARSLIKEFVTLTLEKRGVMYELDDGTSVPEGSDSHIADLTEKIQMLERTRRRYPLNSSARADQTRVIQRLKRELKRARGISQKNNEKVLKEYLSLLFEEDDNPASHSSGQDSKASDFPFSMGGGMGGDVSLGNILGITPAFRAAQTAVGKTKELASNVITLAGVTLKIAATIVPIYEANYKKMFDANRERIKKIREDYKDVYAAVDKAFEGDDIAFLTFCASPGIVMGVKAAQLAPRVTKELLGVITGGTSDKLLGHIKSKSPRTKEDIAAFLLGEEQTEAEKRAARKKREEERRRQSEEDDEDEDAVSRELQALYRARRQSRREKVADQKEKGRNAQNSSFFRDGFLLAEAEDNQNGLSEEEIAKIIYQDPKLMNEYVNTIKDENPDFVKTLGRMQMASEEAIQQYIKDTDGLISQIEGIKSTDNLIAMLKNSPSTEANPQKLGEDIKKLSDEDRKKLLEDTKSKMAVAISNATNKFLESVKKIDPSGSGKFAKDLKSLIEKLKKLKPQEQKAA